jgi:hypothetical protein
LNFRNLRPKMRNLFPKDCNVIHRIRIAHLSSVRVGGATDAVTRRNFHEVAVSMNRRAVFVDLAGFQVNLVCRISSNNGGARAGTSVIAFLSGSQRRPKDDNCFES